MSGKMPDNAGGTPAYAGGYGGQAAGAPHGRSKADAEFPWNHGRGGA